MRSLPPLLLLIGLAGCLTPNQIQPERLHTLDPRISAERHAPVEKTLGVRAPHAARPYELHMAWLDEARQINYYPNDRWAEAPEDYVTRALIDAIGATGRFPDTGYAADMSRPDLLLTGELRKFHENRSTSPATAEIEVRLELREARQTRNFWGGTLVSRIPLEGADPGALARAMEKAVADIAQQAARAIAEAVH